MKTLMEVQDECLTGYVFTVDEFIEMIEDGSIDIYNEDNYGYYHDGEIETEERVYFDKQSLKEAKEKYPYICWYEV